MSRNNLELAEWADDTIRLTFWDTMHGDDVVFVLNADGKAQKVGYTGEGEDEQESLEEVDLVTALRELLSTMKART